MTDVEKIIDSLENDGMHNQAGPLKNRVEWGTVKQILRDAHHTGLRDDSGLYTVEDGWIETHTGKQFFFKRPTPEMVSIKDIAPALSKICRYAGHTKHFYSVAEHCVLMSDWVLENYPKDYAMAKSALLHDAAEPYLCDLPRPIKAALPEFKRLEETIDRAVCAKFNLPYPFPQLIKELDSRILVDERRQVMSQSGNDWGTDALKPLGIKVQFWDPGEAEDNFVFAFADLISMVG